MRLEKLLKFKPNFVNDSNKTPEKQDKKYYVFVRAFGFAIEFGFMIAIPVIAFGWLGKWMDARYHTEYWALVGFLLAIVTSIVLITRKIKEIMRDLKK